MKKFVCLFGVLLLITVPQYNFAGDNSEDNDIYNYEFHGRDHDTKDHKEFYHSPIKIRADFSFLKSTSQYDADGNKHDFSGGDSYTRLREALSVYYHGGKIGDTKLKWGADAEFAFIQTKLKPGDMGLTEYSNNGFTFTPGADIGIRRLGGTRLGVKLGVKYQIDGTKDESDATYLPDFVYATDKQNALGVNLNFNYKICHSSKVYVGVDYWNTFARTQMQKIFNYETYQVEDADVDYDNGNQLAIYGGGDYKWCWGDCGWGYAGLKLNYWNRSNQSYNGETIDKSGANYLSVIPKVGFRWKNIPLNISVSAAYRNEYGIEQGMIGLSGKSILKPSIALEGNIRYSF